MENVVLGSQPLTIEEVVRVSRRATKVEISEQATSSVKNSRDQVEEILREGKTVYGISTGFGILQDKKISLDDLKTLQRNLILSHSAGVGEPLPEEAVRATMLLRAKSLSLGYSGCRNTVINSLVQCLNKGVHPVVPSKGSLGASGDLAPLSHLTLVLIGSGEVIYKGEQVKGADALRKAGIEPLILEAKEGLALINGSQVMTAIGCLGISDAENLSDHADIALSLSLEALQGSLDAFHENLHRLRPHKGQIQTAQNIRSLVAGSSIIKSKTQLQDAYSLRCTPQVHGASKDTLKYVKNVLAIEINSVTDNPLIFPEEDPPSLQGGHFHGQPVALALDFLSIALAELGSISERRVSRMLNPVLSKLPALLVEKSGLNSGLMILQYTNAALVSENKLLASPACVDSIPVSADQEDHVSMGMTSALKLTQVIENLRTILGIELLCAAQAIELADFQNNLGKGTKTAWEIIRNYVPFLEKDRILYQDLEELNKLIKSSEVLLALKKANIDLSSN